MRTSRMLACLLVVAGSLVSLTERADAAPAATTSRYMKTTDPSVVYNQGCAQGRASQQGIIVLDFGSPAFNNATYGSLLFGTNTFRSVLQVEKAAEAFLTGYWNCSPSWPFIVLAIGINNYKGATTGGHGKAWASTANNIDAWITSNHLGSQEAVAGASDMELDWNSVTNTRNWVNGFDSVNTTNYYNFGDAAGCPPYGSCDNGWTSEDVWFVSWGSPPAFPLPEIYTTNGSMAKEWQAVSLYGYTKHGSAVHVAGALSQYQACKDNGGCPSGTNNSASSAWTQLSNVLNADRRTAQSLDFSSDMTWAN